MAEHIEVKCRIDKISNDSYSLVGEKKRTPNNESVTQMISTTPNQTSKKEEEDAP